MVLNKHVNTMTHLFKSNCQYNNRVRLIVLFLLPFLVYVGPFVLQYSIKVIFFLIRNPLNFKHIFIWSRFLSIESQKN